MQQLLIHLGDCKTGSTALQVALAEGRVTVDGDRPCYPAQLNHNGLAENLIRRGWSFAKGTAAPTPREAAFDRLRTLASRFDGSTAPVGIISAEIFEYVAPETLAAAIDAALAQYKGRIRLLAYVRPHAPRLLSSFAEMTKLGRWHGSLDDFLGRAILRGDYHYAPRFARWRAVFGDAFTLRPYLRSRLVHGDLVADVASFAAAGRPWSIEAHQTQNESLSLADLALVRAIHDHIRGGHPLPAGARGRAIQMLGRSLGQVLPASANGVRLQLHRSLAERVMQTYRGDAAALDAAFFDGTPMSDALDHAADDVVEAPQSLIAKDHFGSGDMREIAIWGDIFARLIDADPDHFTRAVRPHDHRPTQGARQARKDGMRRAIGTTLAEIMAARPDPDAAFSGIDRQLTEKIAARFAPDQAPDAAHSLAPEKGPGPASLRLTDAAGDLLLRIAATDPARFAQAIRRPAVGLAVGQDGAKAAADPTTRAYGVTDRIGAVTDRLGPRFTRPLGWLVRTFRQALRRIGR